MFALSSTFVISLLSHIILLFNIVNSQQDVSVAYELSLITALSIL